MPLSPRYERELPGVALLLAGWMCLVPFIQPRHLSPIRAFYDEWLALALGLAAVACVSLSRKNTSGVAPAVSACLALFGVTLLLRAVFAQAAYPQSAFLWGIYALFASIVVILGHELAAFFGQDQVCDVIASFLLAGALANGFAGGLQVFGIPLFLDSLISHIHGHRATGNIGQANLYANYLALGEASLIYLYLRGKISWRWTMTGGVLLVACAGLAASRSSVLYSAVLAFLGYVATTSREGLEARKLSIATLGLLVSVIVAQWFVPVAMNAIGLHVEAGYIRETSPGTQLLQGDPAMQLRLMLWELAFRLFVSAPLIGVGPDEFAGAAFELGLPPSLGGAEVWTSSHNMLLQLLSETGLVGTVLVCCGLGGWLHYSGKLLVRGPTPAAWWILACVSVELLHSLLEYPLWYAHFLAVTALIIGIGGQSSFTVSPFALRILIASGAASGLIMLAVHLTDYIRFDLASPVSAGRSLAPESHVVRDRETLAELSQGLLAPRSELWLFFAFPLNETDIGAKIATGSRVLRLWPSLEAVARQSIFLSLAGRDQEAVALFAHGLKTFGHRRSAVANAIASAPDRTRKLLQPMVEKIR
jgi:O-antigen ligase